MDDQVLFIIEGIENSAEFAYSVAELIRNDENGLENIENHVVEVLKEYKFKKALSFKK